MTANAGRIRTMAVLALGLVQLLQSSLVIAQLTQKTAPGTCSTNLDCALLGDCVKGLCVCARGFTGPNCHKFDLLPAKLATIEGFDNPMYPAWGGKTIYADGQYHFISSYIRNQCYITDYGTNSAYLRATANHPQGPFTFQEEILPPFHHGAQVERALDGGYHIFGDGRNMPDSTVKSNCAVKVGRGRTLGKKESARDLEVRGLYPLGNSPNDVHIVASANKINGPWTQFTIDELSTNLKARNKWYCNKTNLAPLILKNGTVLLGYRSKSCVDMQQQMQVCGNSCQHIGIAVSHHGVHGPYTIRPLGLPVLDGNEDPFLWQSSRGFHFVFHGKTICGSTQEQINTCGSYAYSLDTYTWYMSPFPAYDGRINFDPSTGKSFEMLKLRHRPKILFNNEGVPLVLYNAGQRNSQPYTRNFASAFNVPEMVHFQPPPPCPPKPFENICTQFTRRVYTYNRTEPGCSMMGVENCLWCPEKNLCMPGADNRICSAESIETFYAHC